MVHYSTQLYTTFTQLYTTDLQCTFVVGDGDLVLFASALVNSYDVEDTIGINVKGHHDLRYTSGCRRDARQLKLSKEVLKCDK